jgi:aconitate hydratase
MPEATRPPGLDVPDIGLALFKFDTRLKVQLANPGIITIQVKGGMPVKMQCFAKVIRTNPNVIPFALAGRLSFDPQRDELEGEGGRRFRLRPPAPAPEVPRDGFVRSLEGYAAPPAQRRSIDVEIAEGSERLQRLEPFAAWDGRDLEALPLLLKARGKCTTDHISPAGPWLRYRGHLEKISDNMFTGAVNAFTDATGKGRNLLSGEAGEAFAAIARHYKASGLRWVVVGDENYGEGSSREHAAMSPRLLGCAAVLVRSFARIHESNLKKQGVLPLTFAEPSDYDKVRETDRVSITGLAHLAPGSEVGVVLLHADDSRDELRARHTLNGEQLRWFRAGSALNLLRAQRS